MLALSLISLFLLAASSVSAAPHSLHRRLPYEEELANIIVAHGSEMTGKNRLDLYNAIYAYITVTPGVQIEEAFQWFIEHSTEDGPLHNDAERILSQIQGSNDKEIAAVSSSTKAQSSKKTKQMVAAGVVGTGAAAAAAGGMIGLALNHQKQLNSQNATESGQAASKGSLLSELD